MVAPFTLYCIVYLIGRHYNSNDILCLSYSERYRSWETHNRVPLHSPLQQIKHNTRTGKTRKVVILTKDLLTQTILYPCNFIVSLGWLEGDIQCHLYHFANSSFLPLQQFVKPAALKLVNIERMMQSTFRKLYTNY